jgi:hypothetical protein
MCGKSGTSFWESSFFWCGCVGALAPEIIRLYKLKSRKNLNWQPTYFILSILFALLGGFMAWVLQVTSYYAAFYVGVSFPTIISTISRQGIKVKAPGAKEPAEDSVDLEKEPDTQFEAAYANTSSSNRPQQNNGPQKIRPSLLDIARKFLSAL